MADYKTVTAFDEMGNRLTLTIPVTLPGNERADYLRLLWNTHVQYGQQNVAALAAKGIAYTPDWKGPCYANVPMNIVDDVAEAMEFMGAIVDSRTPITDGTAMVALFSRGYRAHGF